MKILKISDLKNEKAMEFIGTVVDPVFKIWSDDKFKNLVYPENGERNIIEIVKFITAEHSKETIEILSAINGTTAEKYTGNPYTIIAQVIEIISDPELLSVFTSLAQNMAEKSSG